MSKTQRPQIAIYTDGGCSPNPGPGGWAAILIHPDKIRELSGGNPDTTNNRMELTAAIEALKALNQPCDIDFYTDSEYLRKGITQWIEDWAASGWRRGKPGQTEPVANVDLWQELYHRIQRHTIQWHWVKGHAGDSYNERADALASAAIPRQTSESDNSATRVYLRIAGTHPRGPHGWAAAVVREDQTEILQGHAADSTGNHFTLLAALAILKQIPASEPVQFFTNSSYLYDGITRWVQGWRKQGWAKPERFNSEWRRLDQINQERRIAWVRFENTDAPEAFKGLREPAEQARDSG